MKFSALHTLTAGIALSLSMTACGTAEEGTDDLGAALDQLEAQAEQAALREHGVDQEDQDAAAADEEAGAELGDEADEAPRPGERIGAFCNERSAEASPRYHAVADATAGVTVDSCRVSADVLTLGATVRATGMTHRFPLSHAPLDGDLEVVRDGPSVLNWVWSTVGNQLEFRRDPVPLPGEEFRVRYDYAPTCRR